MSLVFVRNQSRLFSERTGHNSSTTIYTGRLIIFSPTSDVTVGIPLKDYSSIKDTCAFSRPNRTSYCTNANFNFSLNLLVMLQNYCAPTKYVSRRHVNVVKRFQPIIVRLISSFTTIVYLILHFHWYIYNAEQIRGHLEKQCIKHNILYSTCCCLFLLKFAIPI